MRHSLVTPLSSYSQLGVAGLTLLGGTGFLSRSYGCTADNALEFGKLAKPSLIFLQHQAIPLSFDAFFSLLSLSKSQPHDLQITVYK